MSRGTSIAVLLGLAVAVPTGVRAAEIVWAGAGSSNWNGGGNWVLGNVPGSSDTVSLKGWEPLVRTSWTITAFNTNSGSPTTNAKDGHLATSWWSGAAMSTSAWVQIDLGSTQTFGGLDLKEILNGTDYPRGYDIYVSSDGSTWGSPIFSNNAGSADDQNQFSDQTARYIKIQINTNSASNWWAISELTVWGTAGDTQLAMGGMTPTSSTSYSSGGQGPATNATDFNRSTLFQTGADQAIGQWFTLNMGTAQTISAITMDSYLSPGDYANGYKVEVSTTAGCNGTTGSYTQVAVGSGTTEFLQVTFASHAALCVRVTLTANSGSNWWTISEFHVYGVPATCTMTASTTMAGLNINNASTFVQGTNNALTITGDFNQSAGTFTGCNNSAVKVSGDFNLSGGTHTATANNFRVDGSFNITGGTFTHNSGRVMLHASSNQPFVTNGATFNNLIVNDGLVSYYTLDEGTGTVVNDSSGYAFSGSLLNTPTWGAGPALNFTNGSSLTVNGTSQYARITRSTIIEPAAVTVSAWIKRNGSQTQFSKIISKTYNNGATSPYGSYELQMNPGGSDTTVVGFESGTTVNSYGVTSGTGAIPDLTWTHVVGVYDPSGPQMRLYVNGVSIGATTPSGTLLYDTSANGDLYFGQNGSLAAAQYFKGSVDDVRIYDRALTDQEIYSLFIGNQPGTSKATQTMSGSPVVVNDFTLSSGTLSAGSNNITVGGSWNNYGGLFTAGTGTVTLNSTTGDVIRSAGQPFNNLTLSGSGATWTLQDWLKVNSTLTMTNGALSPGSYSIHAGNISKTSGTLTAGTGTVVLDSTADQSESSGFSFNNLRIEAPDESGLVGYWKFDEGQGTVVRDSSGTGNDGTLIKTRWTDSVLPPVDFDNHTALVFDNTTTYGTLGTTSMPAANANQSISLWFYSGSNSAGSDHYMMSLYNAASSSGISIGYVHTTNQLAAWKWGPNVLVSVNPPSTGAWHHVVYTYATTGTLSTLYLDGVSVNTSSTATNAATPTTLQIGAYNSVPAYSGYLDDLRIYNVTLTATQVANLYAGGYSGVGSNTVVTLGANLTVNKTLAIDDGTLDTSSYTVNAAATDSTQTATVNGTLKVGSNTVTLNGGVTVGKLGSVTENTAGGKIALGTRGVVEFDEPSGAAVGFPTAAFNWNTFAFWREYVTYSSYVGATTADTVLAMTADGGTKYSWQLPSAHGSLVGTPRWNTEGTSPGTQYIYLITTLGYVYKVLDNGTQLTTVSGGAWPYRNGASATATSPLANDSSNLYWSGFAADGTTPKIFSLKLDGTGLNGTGLTIASNVTAAPALATVSSTPYVFFAIATHVYQETLTLGTQITSTQPTTAVNGRVTVYNNIIYFPENNGKVWALNASASAPTTAWSYPDATGAVVSNIYVDVTANRICFGDAAGYIYVLNSGGTVLNGGYPWQISSSDVFSIAPLSRNGVLMIGTAAGKVYEIDEVNGSNTRSLTHTYTLPGGAAVSNISFNSSANAGNGAYTVSTADGKLYYINAGTDPTSGNP